MTADLLTRLATHRNSRELRGATAEALALYDEAIEALRSSAAALNAVYRERSQLVAALSKVFPASLEVDPAEPDWPVCIIDLPTGQVSWHCAPADLEFFAHLPREAGRTWDGHSTEEKYQRLAALEVQHALKAAPAGRHIRKAWHNREAWCGAELTPKSKLINDLEAAEGIITGTSRIPVCEACWYAAHAQEASQ